MRHSSGLSLAATVDSECLGLPAMEMEAEMEDVLDVCGDGGGSGFTFGFDIDFEYEFDAFRYFDFCREETELDAREAEIWFERAHGYGPSPFVAKRSMGKDFLNNNVNVSPKLKNVEDVSQANDHTGIGRDPTFSVIDGSYKGWTTEDPMTCNNSEALLNPIVKGPNVKCSTLMKPTASQLAKQFWPQEQKHYSWFPKTLSCKNGKDQLEVGDQAPKRQKLEGGYMHKAVVAMQETNFIHKIPHKKKETDPVRGKIKLTIPREPELQTARRARLTRSKIHNEQQESSDPTAHMFKAHPLNKKILQAPSLPLHKRSTPQPPEFQVFHFKTSQRAAQHLRSGTASSVANNSLASTLPARVVRIKGLEDDASGIPQISKLNGIIDGVHDNCENKLPRLKTRPLNKKILPNRPNASESYPSKREPSMHTDFSILSGKRFQTKPPTDLFNKLSLVPDARRSSISDAVTLPFGTSFKDSKENRTKNKHCEKEVKQRNVLTQIHQPTGGSSSQIH